MSPQPDPGPFESADPSHREPVGQIHPEPVDPDIDERRPEQHAELSTHPATLPMIAMGGMVGASARYSLEVLWPAGSGAFPWATFWINVSGSFLIGVLMVVVQDSRIHRLTRPFLGVGVIGGFTTFSTYALQTRGLVASSHTLLGLSYVLGTAITALLAVAAGLTLTRAALRRHEGTDV